MHPVVESADLDHLLERPQNELWGATKGLKTGFLYFRAPRVA